jgi:homoserine O-acetyltransferase
LILAGSGDLLNPEFEAMEAARYIPDVRYVEINPRRPMGHLSGAGTTAPENELQNAEIAAFLDMITDHDRKLESPPNR